VFFAISSSSDNFIIGLSYAAKKISINSFINLTVAFISCVGTIAAMIFGKILLRFISTEYTNMLGSIILVLIGLYMLLSAFKKMILNKKQAASKHHLNAYNEVLSHPEVVDKNNSQTIEFKEAIILGVILSINNIGLGIGASLSNLNIYITSLTSFFFSLIFIKLGYYFGEMVSSSKLSEYSEIISACIILLLGLYEMFI